MKLPQQQFYAYDQSLSSTLGHVHHLDKYEELLTKHDMPEL